jgi:metaxin
MYLTPNFEKFTVPSYIDTQSSSSFIRIINAWELRSAASAELEKHTPLVDVDGLYLEADEAYAALDNLMSRMQSSKSGEKPSLLEATLFAYLFLLLETPYSSWADSRLVDIVRKYPNLRKREASLNASHFGTLRPPKLYGVAAS